jgi:hypothetical protein
VKTSSRLFAVTVVTSLIVLTSGRNLLAQANPQSDELKISVPGGGATIADIFIAEPTGAGTEPSALFSPSGGPVLVPAGGLSAFFPAGLPGLSYVILTEPSGELPDPTELPPVFYGPATAQVQVSDLIISGTGQTQVTPFIALVSDNNPDLAKYVSALPAGVPFLTETGALQDLTALLVPPPAFSGTPVDVAVVSAVPEPSTLALVVLGAVPILIARRRLSVR